MAGARAVDDLGSALDAALALADRKLRVKTVLSIMADAMAAAGLARDDAGGLKRAILRPGDLDAHQRAVVTQLAAYPRLPIYPYPVPSAAWAIRQWLGLDPPGPLFAGGGSSGTLYETLRAARTRSEAEAIGRLVGLPMPMRLEVLADLYLLPNDYGAPHVGYLLGDPHAIPPDPDPGGRVPLGDITGASADWATGMAERMIAIEDAPTLYLGPADGETRLLHLPVLLALVRSGQPIDPRFDRLLEVDRRIDPALVHECTAALPAGRRERAILAALARVPDAELDLPIPDLRIAFRRRAPRRHDRDDALARQLDDAAGEDLDPATIEYLRIETPDGRHLYDGWLVPPDSGTFFAAGTTDIVAELFQSGLQCPDRSLRAALLALLAAPRPGPKTRRPSSKSAKTPPKP